MKESMDVLVERGDWQAVQERFNEQEFMRHLGIVVDLGNPDEPRCEMPEIASYHLGGIGQDFVNGAVTARSTSRIGKNLFAEATVFNPAGEPRVHATGVVRIGIKRS